ncbi:carboxylesterase [Colletotrichum cereale]|nr:carboxylesterase [Colletotrichum cereale]
MPPFAYLALLGGLAIGSPTERENHSGFLTVETSNGPITGHIAPNSSNVLEYLGIPYVKPPIGNLRFALPEPFTSNQSFHASNFGFDCPLSPSRQIDYPDMTPQAQRIISYFASGAGTPQSEDCLTLNIWTKQANEARSYRKSVIVFFYGGRFAIGNTNSPFYNGKLFAAAQDVVVVTITIAGQSSGGVAVDYWSYAYTEDPIVTVAAAINCLNTTNAMRCMRTRRWEDIKSAAAAVRPASSSSVLRSIPPFYPMVDNETVFPDYMSLTKTGKFSSLPVLFGNNNNEDGYYRIPAYGNGVVPTSDQVKSFLLESFTCPNTYQAEARRERGISTWVYRYFGDWGNTRLFPTSGAYHGVDLHMMFGGSENVSGIAPSDPQKQTTALMQKVWATFANDPLNGLSSVVGWPKFDPSEESLILLAFENNPEPQFVKPEVYDAPCSTITLGALATPASASIGFEKW